MTDNDVKELATKHLKHAFKRKGGKYNQHPGDWTDAKNVDKNLYLRLIDGKKHI